MFSLCICIYIIYIINLFYLINIPRQGILLPEQLPWKEVLDSISIYLGEMRSGPVDWNPLKSRTDLYSGWNEDKVDELDPWQFCNFMIPGVPSCQF